MLYQLAIYALSSVGDRTSTIIYLSLDDKPSIQKIDISNPETGNMKVSTRNNGTFSSDGNGYGIRLSKRDATKSFSFFNS